MTYVIMGIDECGDEFRAHGTDFIEKEHTFPDFDDNDEAMWDAFLSWESSITDRVNREWREIYGAECRLFMQESDRSRYRRMRFCGI